jgi:DNA polymerase phi
MSKVVVDAPGRLLSIFFSKNAINCLIKALRDDDRYLQRTGQRVVQNIHKRATAQPGLTSILLQGLLLAANFSDFDKITKTKTIEKLLWQRDINVQNDIASMLKGCFWHPTRTDPADIIKRRRCIIVLQAKLFPHCVSSLESLEAASITTSAALHLLESWIDIAFFKTNTTTIAEPFSDGSRDFARMKLSTHLEQSLKAGESGKCLFREAILHVRRSEKEASATPVVGFEPAVRSVIEQGWKRLELIPLNGSTKQSSSSASLALLYCLVLFQSYSGEAEAVEILEDLLAYHDKLDAKQNTSGLGETDDQSDALIEILLSFASRPSKFLRRLINTVFEGIAPSVTSKGLQSLLRVLATKESVEGQQEMFDAADEDANRDDEDEGDASDVDMIDSDVEVVSSSSKASSDADSDDSDSDSEDAEDDSEDEELAAFDTKLAAALGTRKLTNGVEDDDDDSTSGASDIDMDDDQMMVLDEKLAEVFRARQQESSKKKEKKDAKENIVNFKNRVLDLIDVYLKVEYLASQSLELLLPLLNLARKTKTKQLADRACLILNEFCKRCKGANVPSSNDALQGIELLLALHAEAGTGASNAHANATSHASILVVKSLVNSGVKIGDVVDVYANTQKRMLTDKKCKIQNGLFTDWNNWCVSAREKFAE